MIPGYLSGALRGRPAIPGYQWRARTYPAAVRAIELAEAVHGPPEPTCLCGGRITRPGNAAGQSFVSYRCDSCGKPPS